MIVLPLASEKGISTFEVGFQAEDKRAEILQADKIQLPASDIAIGRDHLSQMLSLESYKDKPEELTKWIRKNAAYNPRARVIYVTTGNYENTDFYDVYKLPLPPEKPNILVDFLYGFLVNDLRFTIPNKEKGKELSFSRIGLNSMINEETINEISKIKEASINKQDFFYRLEQSNYEDRLELLDFLNTLSFTPIEHGTFETSLMQKLKEGFQAIHDGKWLKSIQKFENMAEDNFEQYMALNTLNHIFYEKSLWFEDQKIYQKKSVA